MCAKSAQRARPTMHFVFRARVGGRQVEGCDFLHVDDDRAIDELAVMIRPLSAALALAEAMNTLASGADSIRLPV
jgi:hypothetical protein